MMRTTVNLISEPTAVVARVNTMDDNKKFITVELASGCTIILSGYDYDACVTARQIVEALTHAADSIEMELRGVPLEMRS